MSYINEALKKAQKDKDANRMGYMHSIGKSGNMERSFDKRYIYLSLIVILLAALLIYLKPGKQAVHDTEVRAETIIPKPAAVDDVKKNKVMPVTDKKQNPVNDILKIENREKEPSEQMEKRYAQAASLLKEGNLKGAEDIFREILAQDPGHSNSLNDMGVLYLHERKYEEAIDFFEKALRLKPGFVNPYYNLACVYSLQNEGEKSMTYLLKAIEIDKKVKEWAKEDPDLEYLRSYAGSR